MLREIGHRVHAAEGDIGRRQPGAQGFAVERAQDPFQHRLDLVAVLDPRDLGCVFGRRREVRALKHRFGEAPPFAVVLAGDHHPVAVGGLEGAVGHQRRVAERHARPDAASIFVPHQRRGHPVRHRGEQRGLDRGALAVDAALDERLQHGGMAEHAGRDIAGGDADPSGLRLRSRHRRHAAFRLHQHVVGLHPVVGRPGLAIAGNIDRDEAGITGSQVSRAETGALRRARRQVLHPDIGGCENAVEQRAVVLVLDVDDERLLAPVEIDEIGGAAAHIVVVAAGEIAFPAFELDDPRAGVGQPRGQERRGDGLLQAHHQQPLERSVHDRPPPQPAPGQDRRSRPACKPAGPGPGRQCGPAAAAASFEAGLSGSLRRGSEAPGRLRNVSWDVMSCHVFHAELSCAPAIPGITLSVPARLPDFSPGPSVAGFGAWHFSFSIPFCSFRLPAAGP